MSTEKGQQNTAFVGDDGQRLPSTEKSNRNSYSLELAEKKDLDADYDPYAHRTVEHPTTDTDTLIHLLKGSLGTGILAMPNAFLHSGYIVGSIGTVLIGILCTYCIHLLIDASYILCKRNKIPKLTYPGVTITALNGGPDFLKKLAPHVLHLINTFLLIYQLGTCCVYVVFVSSNIKSIVDNYTTDKTDIRLFMLLILLPLILINWVRNLKYLAPFSSIANIVTLVSFGLIGYYMFREPLSTDGKNAAGPLLEYPLFFGTVLFALEAIGVILPLENEMKTPKSFGKRTGVLNKAMVFIVLLYVAMGFFGYLRYGADIKGSITLNLPANEILALSVKGMLAFSIFITHGLACYVAIDITWNEYMLKHFKDSPRKLFWEYVARTCLVLITFLLAVAIPNLELFISLFGALCLSTLGLVFPALVDISTHWYERHGAAKLWLITKNTIIFVCGILGLLIGTYTSLVEIIKTFFEEESH